MPGGRVRIALIGCGAVSELLYAPALQAATHEGLAVVEAVIDPNGERRAVLAAALEGTRAFSDLHEMDRAGVTPDLAIVAAPHRYHADLAVKCLENSVAVLCEKPMAITTAECDRMITAARRADRVLAIGHFRRFFPSCQVMKAILSSGLLGPVVSFRFLEGEAYSWPARSASFFDPDAAGGGVLIDAGSHTLDLLLWWLGDVAEVEYEDDAMGGVEANCVLRLTTGSGATGIVQLSRDWPLPNRYVIECAKGWLACKYGAVDRLEWGFHNSPYGMETLIWPMAGTDQARLHVLEGAIPGFRDCFVNQLRDVLAAVVTGGPVLVPGIEARRTVQLIETCYRNRRLLDMPWLAPLEMRGARQLAGV
jgi:predicted dehydrogenase